MFRLSYQAPGGLLGWLSDQLSAPIVRGNIHHTPAAQASEPEFRSLAFTFTVDKQDGRRFSGTFASPRSSSKAVAVIARSGAIYLVTGRRR